MRLSVGASPRDVVTMVLRQGLLLTSIGLAVGVVGAVFLNRAMESLLFQVSPTDPSTFVLVSALLLGTTTLACWLPARRAAALQPMEALRYE